MCRATLRHVLALVAASCLVAGATVAVGASPTSAGHIIGISVGPLTVFPDFDEDVSDYAVRCASGANDVTVHVDAPTASGITVDGVSVASGADTVVTVVENELIVVAVTDGATTTEYFYRCLPADFPLYTIDKPGTPGPGWFLIAFGLCATSCPVTGGPYVVVMDTNGTPVWYKRNRLFVADQKLYGDGHIAFFELGPPRPKGYQVYTLDGSFVGTRRTVGSATDTHELEALANGNDALLTYPTRQGVDLTSIGFGPDETVQDGHIQEIDPAGNLVWEWRSEDHIAVEETVLRSRDLVHLNSVDEFPNGDLLVSGRHVGVYRISRSTGEVIWKLGGTSTAKSLAVVDSPEYAAGPVRQHDARVLPDGTILVFDNQWVGGIARVVQFGIDETSKTAYRLWQRKHSDGVFSRFYGGARRQPDGHTVIAWGEQGPMLEEVDLDGVRQLAIEASGEQQYRVVKYPLDTFDAATLRAAAGGSFENDAPLDPVAVAGDQSATVSWSAPSAGGVVTGYVVTAEPDGQTCETTGALSCVVAGLNAGSAFTFIVNARNDFGTSVGSLRSNKVTPFDASAPVVTIAVPAADSVHLLGAAVDADYTCDEPPTGSAVVQCAGDVPSGDPIDTASLGPKTFTVETADSVGNSDTVTHDYVVAQLPGAPGVPSAVSSNGAADVSWSAPASDGGAPILEYVVTASPGGSTCATGGASSCTVPGLSNGTPYTFSVTAANGAGVGPASAASAPATPSTVLERLAPARLVDTRPGGVKIGAADGTGPPLRFTVLDRAGVPAAGVGAVSLTVTVDDTGLPDAGIGYATVDGCGSPRPTASNLNFGAAQTIANSVITPISPSGEVCVYVYGTAHVLVDINGFFPDGGPYAPATRAVSKTQPPPLFHPVAPYRLADTRPGGVRVGAADGSGTPLRVRALERGGLPASGVDAVSLTVTVDDTGLPDAGIGYVTVDGCGVRPEASNLNFDAGRTIANSVIVPVAANGDVCVYVYGTAHVLVDVNGYFPAGSDFGALAPHRLEDTRPGGVKVGAADGTGPPLRFDVHGRGGVPASGVGAVSLTVTVDDTELPVAGIGFVTVDGCGSPRPTASNLNFDAGQTVANSVITPVSPAGEVCVYVYGSAHVLVDVNGWFPD